MAKFKSDTHWRDTARHPRFFMIDARAAFPFLFFLAHMRFWTFALALITMGFFALLEKFGFTLAIFFRWLRSFIAGPYKMASPWWRE